MKAVLPEATRLWAR